MKPVPWSTLRALHDHFATIALHLFDQEGEVHPQVFVVEISNEQSPLKVLALPPELLRPMFSEEAAKDALASFMREALKESSALHKGIAHQFGCRPDVIVQINEAWLSRLKEGAEHEKFITGQKTPSEDPLREEVVVVTLHTAMGSVPCLHSVVNEPTRHCRRSEFPDKGQSWQAGGRFVLHSEEKPEGFSH